MEWSLKVTNLCMHLKKITHNCVRFTWYLWINYINTHELHNFQPTKDVELKTKFTAKPLTDISAHRRMANAKTLMNDVYHARITKDQLFICGKCAKCMSMSSWHDVKVWIELKVVRGASSRRSAVKSLTCKISSKDGRGDEETWRKSCQDETIVQVCNLKFYTSAIL